MTMTTRRSQVLRNGLLIGAAAAVVIGGSAAAARAKSAPLSQSTSGRVAASPVTEPSAAPITEPEEWDEFTPVLDRDGSVAGWMKNSEFDGIFPPPDVVRIRDSNGVVIGVSLPGERFKTLDEAVATGGISSSTAADLADDPAEVPPADLVAMADDVRSSPGE